jgi:hypothetical protein
MKVMRGKGVSEKSTQQGYIVTSSLQHLLSSSYHVFVIKR